MTYLIADSNTKDLQTIVFSGEGGEVVAVFTDLKKAQKYIDDAGWQDKASVASLEPIDFMEWLIKCHRDGIKFMATNPSRADHESGLRIDTLDIEAHLKHAGQHIALVADPDF